MQGQVKADLSLYLLCLPEHWGWLCIAHCCLTRQPRPSIWWGCKCDQMEKKGAFGRGAADALISGMGLLWMHPERVQIYGFHSRPWSFLLTCCGLISSECVKIWRLYHIVPSTDFKREYFSRSRNKKMHKTFLTSLSLCTFDYNSGQWCALQSCNWLQQRLHRDSASDFDDTH